MPTPTTPPAPLSPPIRVASLAETTRWCDRWRAAGDRIVVTNGCFDLLHVGHVRYLEAARALGDRLVIALNDDASVHHLKGAGRPILPAAERAELLAALRSVDVVTVFEGPTAVGVVAALRPDVYVKGGDYDPTAHRPPEADAAEAIGAIVRFVPFVDGRSTRSIIAAIRAGESAGEPR